MGRGWDYTNCPERRQVGTLSRRRCRPDRHGRRNPTRRTEDLSAAPRRPPPRRESRRSREGGKPRNEIHTCARSVRTGASFYEVRRAGSTRPFGAGREYRWLRSARSAGNCLISRVIATRHDRRATPDEGRRRPDDGSALPVLSAACASMRGRLRGARQRSMVRPGTKRIRARRGWLLTERWRCRPEARNVATPDAGRSLNATASAMRS